MKKKKIIILGVVAIALISVSGAFALNGYFGGGGDNAIPEDTMTRGLVASWDFDEGSGDIAYDATTNNNHGNFPHTGPGLKFQGDDDYVDCGSDASLDMGTSDFTLETWIYIDDASVINQAIIDKGDSVSTQRKRYAIYIGNNSLVFLIADTGTVTSKVFGTLTSDTWYHIVVSADRSGNAVMYVNGEQEETLDISGESGSLDGDRNLIIGYKSSTPSGITYFNGSIDEVRIYSRALGAAEVNEHYHGIFSDNTGRVGYWPFDEGQGDVVDNSGSCGASCDGDLDGYTSAQQVAGYGDTNDTGWTTLAAPMSNFAPTWSEGKEGNGLEFDGKNDYVNCGNDSSLDITDAITIEAWVKLAELPDDWVRIVSKAETSNPYIGYLVDITNENKISLLLANSGGSKRIKGITLSADVWYHISATYDGTTLKLFTNGVEESDTGTIAFIGSNSEDVYIGSWGAVGGEFNGSIDGVKIYNRALSAEEVRYHYNRGGPVAHWKFDEGSGESAKDSSGNNNDGTLKSSALDFDGTNDYVDTNSTFQSTFRDSFTIEAWIKPTDGQPAALNMIMGSKNVAEQDFMNFNIKTGGELNVRYESNDNVTLAKTTSAVFSNGQQDWTHIVILIDKTVGSHGQIYIYVNGVLQTLDGTDDGDLDTSSVVMGDWTSVDELFIGARNNAGSSEYWFDGAIDEVRIYNAALSAEEVARHYDGDFSQDPTANLVMLHHFEEGTLCDTCADPGGVDADCLTDDSGTGNHGTLYNFDDLPNYDAGVDGWITTNKKPSLRWTGGRFASAGNFDGGGDRVYQAYDSAFDFGTSSFTISSWFKHNTIAISSDYLLSRYDDDQGYKVWMDDSGDMCFGIDDDNSWGPDDSACTSGIDYDDNQWHHLTAYKDGTTAIYLYIDSVLVASKIGLDATGTLTSNSASFNIGSDAGVGSEVPNASYYINTWEGEIDDLKVYAYARSADEIRLDYNAGFAVRFGGRSLLVSDTNSCSLDPAACMDYGLVGHWNMDEAGGDTLYDQSDNGNDGTLGSGTGADTSDPKWVGGQTSPQLGGGLASTALSFDGQDDYVDCGNDASLNDNTGIFTFEAWVKASTDVSNNREVISLYTAGVSYQMINIQITTGVVRFIVGGADNKVDSPLAYNDNQWHHIVGVSTGKNLPIYLYVDGDKVVDGTSGSAIIGTKTLFIGIRSGSLYPFNGSIDGVKIYNRALSAEEVRYHYNRGGPVLHYNFNEGSGQYARDSIGTADAQLGVNASSSGDSNDPSWGRP